VSLFLFARFALFFSLAKKKRYSTRV